MTHIDIFDTTLRDGEQSEGIAFTLQDKLRITQLLDDFGIDYIEGGWPGSNPKAEEYFLEVKNLPLKHAKIVAFGSTCRAKANAAEDENLIALVKAKPDAACIFGKTWDFHVHEALKISLEKNLEIITQSIVFLKSNLAEVFFDAEHFFDGFKANPEYATACLLAAQEGGADVIVLCDTNGGTLPHEIIKILQTIRPKLNTALGIHTHNDTDCAVANSIMAINQGCTQVQGTMNGYGERCGNANLCSIIPLLLLKLNYTTSQADTLNQLTSLSRHISEIANLPPTAHQPFVGHSAFSHKGGIHVSAILKHAETYEHIRPDQVGNQQRVVISELAGVSNLTYKAHELGIDLENKSVEIKDLLKTIKNLEKDGYQFEEGEASFELLLRRLAHGQVSMFSLIGFRVITEKKGSYDMGIEATVKLSVNEHEILVAAEGNGPVDALDKAFRKALIPFYPAIETIHLTDFRVRVLDSTHGTKAKVRVIINSSKGSASWGTVGVSENIIEACWHALSDSFEYCLIKGY